MPDLTLPDAAEIAHQVAQALTEDLRAGDLTAALIPEYTMASASLISRESGVLAGQAWFDACFHALDADVDIQWHRNDGQRFDANQHLCSIHGPARALLSAERTAMNFLQTLSATATLTARYVEAVAGTPTHILDTRKTLPGLRLAQKYAVRCGGGYNHRMGLYDGVLIKENHILAAGSLQAAVTQAQQRYPELPIEVEVETLDELHMALASRATIIMLDNFSLAAIEAAVALTQGQALLEASGGVTLDNVAAVAATGVDRISIGELTKHIQAVDLSMRIEQRSAPSQ